MNIIIVIDTIDVTSIWKPTLSVLKYDTLKNPSLDKLMKKPTKETTVVNKLYHPYSSGAIKLASIINNKKPIPLFKKE